MGEGVYRGLIEGDWDRLLGDLGCEVQVRSAPTWSDVSGRYVADDHRLVYYHFVCTLIGVVIRQVKAFFRGYGSFVAECS